MSEKHAWWAWALKNAVCIYCWTTLAIRFGHWWIALFAILFMSSLELQKNPPYYHSICDYCGRYSPEGHTHDEAEHRRIEAGWIRYRRGDVWEDICPDCQDKNHIHYTRINY